MAVAELLCVGISGKADMFRELLVELNKMFAQCTMLLDGVTRKKAGIISKKADFNKFTEDEKKLLAITRSLAGAVKAVIDTPILNEKGEVSQAAEETYQSLSEGLEKFNEQVQYIESCDIKAKPVQPKLVKKAKATKSKSKVKSSKNRASNNGAQPNKILDAVRNIFAPILAFFFMILAFGLLGESLLVACFAFTMSLLLIMNTQTEFKLFRFMRNIAYVTLIAEFGTLLYQYVLIWTSMKYFWIADILAFFISAFIVGTIDSKKSKRVSNFSRLLEITMTCMMLFSIGLPIFKVLTGWIGLSFNISMIIIEILFVIAAWGNIFES